MMKKLQPFVVILELLIIGCSPQVVTPTATSPTISITSTPTPTPLKATPTPTLSPTKENQLYPDVPLPDVSVMYRLQTPQADQLIHVLEMSRSDAIYNLDLNDDLQQAYMDNHSDIDTAIAGDLRRYYPNGSNEISEFSRRTDFEDSSFMPSESTGVILIADVIKYLNEKDLALVDGQVINYPSMELKVFSAGGSRWQILTNYEDDFGLQRLILIQEISPKRYEIPTNFAEKSIYVYSPDDTPEIITNYDFNGDGKNDLLIIGWSYMAGSVSGNMHIYALDESGLQEIGRARLPSIHPYYGEVNRSSYQIIQKSNEIAQIQITWPRFTWFDCSWTTTYIYSWKNNNEQKTTTGAEIPNKPECYVAKAFENESPAEKILWYQKAITNLNPKLTSNDYIAWLKLQLSMAYAMQGQNNEAQKTLDEILNGKDKGKFAQLVTEAASNGTNSPIRTCQILNEKARELARDNQAFGTEIDGYLAMTPTYPLDFYPAPFIVCPFSDVFTELLKKETSQNLDLPSWITSLSIQVRDLQTMNLDSDKDNEWVGLLGDRDQTITIFDFYDSHWQMNSTWSFDAPAEMQARPYEVISENVALEILALVSYPPHKKQTCPENTKNYELLVIAKGKEDYQTWKFLDIFCAKESPVDLSDAEAFLRFMDENENTIISNTVFDINNPNTPSGEISKKISEITKRTVTAETPEITRQELFSLLADFNDDTPASKIVQAQLSYLIGLSYEYENQPEQAVQSYLELIRKYPDSLWSWLAWARLTPNPITPTP